MPENASCCIEGFPKKSSALECMDQWADTLRVVCTVRIASVSA